MKKKWVFGGLVLVVLLFFVFLPAIQEGTEVQQYNQELRRQKYRNDLAQMRAEIRANGWDFEVDVNEAMQYSIEQLCNFKPELQPQDLDYEEDCDEAVPAATLPSSYMGSIRRSRTRAAAVPAGLSGRLAPWKRLTKRSTE